MALYKFGAHNKYSNSLLFKKNAGNKICLKLLVVSPSLIAFCDLLFLFRTVLCKTLLDILAERKLNW